MLDKILEKRNSKVDIVLNIEVPFDEIITRIVNRRNCMECNEIYNDITIEKISIIRYLLFYVENRNLLTEQYIYCIVKHPYKMGWEGAYAGIHRNASKGGM